MMIEELTLGAIYVLSLETDGVVKSVQKVSMLYGGFSTYSVIDVGDVFGSAIDSLGDTDGDNIADMAVSAYHDDDGGTSTGSENVIFLQSDGSVKAAQKLSMLYGNMNAFYTLDASDVFSFLQWRL